MGRIPSMRTPGTPQPRAAVAAEGRRSTRSTHTELRRPGPVKPVSPDARPSRQPARPVDKQPLPPLPASNVEASQGHPRHQASDAGHDLLFAGIDEVLARLSPALTATPTPGTPAATAFSAAVALERLAEGARLLRVDGAVVAEDGRWSRLLAIATARSSLPEDTPHPGALALAVWAHAALGLPPAAQLVTRALAAARLPSQHGASEWRCKLSWALQRLQRHGDAEEVHGAMGVPWQLALGFMPHLSMDALLGEVNVRHEVILLEGREVQESRGTAWQSDRGVSFLYSGKEMQPDAGGAGMTPHVAAVRDALEAKYGVLYDSVLVNHYPDGKAGMRYHRDPLYGVWSSDTAVVSVGDTREFVFRQVPLAQPPAAGPAATAALGGLLPKRSGKLKETEHFRYLVSNGDAVRMTGDCQDCWQHCIKVEKDAAHAGPRLSLVFKKLLIPLTPPSP